MNKVPKLYIRILGNDNSYLLVDKIKSSFQYYYGKPQAIYIGYNRSSSKGRGSFHYVLFSGSVEHPLDIARAEVAVLMTSIDLQVRLHCEIRWF